MLFSQFASAEGRRVLADKLKFFEGVIRKLEDIYDIRPFGAQSAQSLLELWLLVVTIRPRTVFELGCGMRSSTIALALAAAEVPECRVCGVDIAPIDFPRFASQHFPDLRFGPVVDTAVEATAFEIPDQWPRPILMLYDAHDGGVPGKIISRHAIAKWFPKLAGQTVAIHDCLVVSPDFVLPTERFAKAMHWSGRCIAGFGEVQHLVEWMNREHIDFWRPGDELEQLILAGSDSCLIALTLPA
jgi:hypothetical protein